MDNESNGANAGEKTAERIFGMIGLARRAGQLSFGFDAVLEDIRAGRAKAVLVSYDASDRTARKMKEASTKKGTPYVVLTLSKAECGSAAGRPDTAALAVRSVGMAAKLIALAGTGANGHAESETRPADSGKETAQEIPAERTDTGGGLE